MPRTFGVDPNTTTVTEGEQRQNRVKFRISRHMSGEFLEFNLTNQVAKGAHHAVGYIRVSTVDQNTVRQLDGIDV